VFKHLKSLHTTRGFGEGGNGGITRYGETRVFKGNYRVSQSQTKVIWKVTARCRIVLSSIKQLVSPLPEAHLLLTSSLSSFRRFSLRLTVSTRFCDEKYLFNIGNQTASIYNNNINQNQNQN